MNSMRYKLLGRSGLRVSELALGTMTFGEDWGWGAPKDVARQIFDRFVARGGNLIDTACNYTNGTSEQFVGEFVASDRDYFALSTKYTLRNHRARGDDFNAGGNHRKNMVRSVEGSLRRLKTDYIDLLWLHIWDGTTPIDEILRAMDDLVRSGKVLYVGISDTPAWIAAYAVATAELARWPRFAGYQGEYSLAERGAERELLPMTRALDLAFFAFGLLHGGGLTGKFNRARSATDEPTREDSVSERARSTAAVVMEVAAAVERTPSQVAINWVRQQAPNVIPILGARRLNQIEDNLGALDFELTDEQCNRLSAANPLPDEYPGHFVALPHLRKLVFGDAIDLLDNHRPWG